MAVPMTEPALLEVDELNVEVGGTRRTVHAVSDVSLRLRAGEAVAIVGESGCGKTMTLRAIAGLLPAQARITGGSVRFDGQELVGMPRREARRLLGRRIGTIFQDPTQSLNPVRQVGEQIAEGPAYHFGLSRSASRDRARELMEMVGIARADSRMDAYPHELSGGLRQRVMIAIAISCGPDVLLCDEPTTALDVTLQDQILRLLTEFRRERNIAILFVTHDLAVVAEFCSRIAVMYAGQAVETGEVAEVLDEPRHAYTLGLLRAVPRFAADRSPLVTIPGAPPSLVEPPPGCRFLARCSMASSACADTPAAINMLSERRMTRCLRHEACAERARTGT
jgi:oligopeptide/dipeptide ABC transporter ATP-binding protein